jgi:hypothetical protein
MMVDSVVQRKEIEMDESIPISRLKGIRLIFEDDLYELARFVMKVQLARDTPTMKTRATVGLIISHYARMLLTSDHQFRRVVESHGIHINTVVEPDD